MRDWCSPAGVTVTVYRASEMSRDAWVKAIRETDIAILPRLDIIISRKGKERPTHDFAMAVAEVIERAALVVDVNANATSDDKTAWRAAYADGLRRASAGRRKLDRKSAQRMARLSHAKRNGVARRWNDDNPSARARLAQCKAIWKSNEYPTWEEARAALPEELRHLSRASLWRLLGTRTKPTSMRGKMPSRSVIYFVRPGARKQVKIGTTGDLKNRLNGLRHPLLGKLRVLAVHAGGRDVERALHARFAAYSIAGNEWFRLEGELLDYIKAVPKWPGIK